MSGTKLRTAFAGFQHNHLYQIYEMAVKNQRIQIAGCWEASSEIRRQAKQKYQIEFSYDTYQHLLDDPVTDIVVIGSYYSRRGQMAIEALRAGKHVFSDKPLCTTLNELSQIEALAKEKGLCVGLMLDLRFHPHAACMKQLIENETLGKIHCVRFGGQHPLLFDSRPSRYFDPDKYGGVINDIAIHGIDLIRYLTGLGVKEIAAARCWNAFSVQNTAFQDSGQLMLVLENNAGVIADVSYALPDSFNYSMPCYWSFEFWGEKGMASFSYHSDGVSLYCNGNRSVKIVKGHAPGSDCLADFIRQIEGEGQVVLPTQDVFASTRDTLRVQHAADTV